MKIIWYIFIRHFYHISFIFNLTNHYFRSILYLLAELIYFDTVMKFHHRVTQSFTESYFLISNQLNSVLLCGELIHIPAERSEQIFHIRRNLLYNNTLDVPP